MTDGGRFLVAPLLGMTAAWRSRVASAQNESPHCCQSRAKSRDLLSSAVSRGQIPRRAVLCVTARRYDPEMRGPDYTLDFDRLRRVGFPEVVLAERQDSPSRSSRSAVSSPARTTCSSRDLTPERWEELATRPLPGRADYDPRSATLHPVRRQADAARRGLRLAS